MATAADAVDVQVWEALDQLPYFRPDADGDPEVTRLRQAVAAADVVWIATPEYAGGMPGALKNALDWLVGSGELYGKRIVVLSAADALVGAVAEKALELVRCLASSLRNGRRMATERRQSGTTPAHQRAHQRDRRRRRRGSDEHGDVWTAGTVAGVSWHIITSLGHGA